MRWTTTLLAVMCVSFPLLAGQDWEGKLAPLLLEGDFSQAVIEGERVMAEYKESRPPAQLYYYLYLVYSNLSRPLRAEDIKRILVKEYRYEFPVGRVKKIPVEGGKEVYQVGAFRSKKNAKRLARRLRSRGLEVWIKFESGLYKVRFSCRGDCQVSLKVINSLGLSARKVGH